MRRGVLLALLLVMPSAAQPDVGELTRPLDELIGQTVPPAVSTAYAALGQNITREDVRLYADLNFTEGGIGVLGLLLGSGKAQVDASIHLRGEMRVISTERIRAIIEGDNAYNITAENATWASEVFLPAEVFRLTVAAEVIAAFQEEQGESLRRLVERSLPELEVISLEIGWENVHPYDSLSDLSLTEPPIVVTLDAKVRYLRVESVPSLVDLYINGRKPADDPQKQYVQKLKEENGKPLTARDFFAAAAYTQLLNLSMQPGWSLDVRLQVPRGYSFEYANHAVHLADERTAEFQIGGESDDEKEVVLVSITHRRAVALALLSTLFMLGGLFALPSRYLYGRFRMPGLREKAGEK